MSFSEIALFALIAWIAIGIIAAFTCASLERKLHLDKYLIKDPVDLLISIALWPLLIVIMMGLVNPPAAKPLPKKKIKIIVSEDNETEEAFANRCKRL